MTKDEEKGYIERVLAGDESAYEPLVTENQTKVYRLALRILKNEADAEDAAQEAFLKAYTSLADFRGDSRFSVWLYRLTNNICIDMLRKNKRAVIVSLQTEDDDGEETELAIPDERYSPERLAERAADRDAVRSALASLPDDCREILALRESAGLSYDEIAAALSLEVGTVKSRLNRARKKSCGSEELSGDLPSAEPTPEERLLQQERRQALERALTALPQRDRLLFYRKYYYRQSTAQIAAELGTTERAVEGRLYRIKELYGCTGRPNEGLRIDPVEQAKRIREAEQNDPLLRGRVIHGVADPAIFDESRGESIAAMMERSPHFLHWQPGDHTRLAGKMQFHYRLRFAPDGRPMLQVFSSCKHFIRTLPNLVYDESNVEDIDTRQEDHIYDECRYVLMEHPISPPEASAAPPRPDDPLELHRQARFYRI